MAKWLLALLLLAPIRAHALFDAAIVGGGTDPTKVAKSGDTMTGNLSLSASTLTVNGPIFSTGTAGSIPFSGLGTRFMWIPDKAAIRAGGVFSHTADLDNANVGTQSVGFGADSMAFGSNAVVSGGYVNTAKTDYCTVGGGLFNTADGIYSTVGGGSHNTTGAGGQVAIAGGQYNVGGGNNAAIGGGNGNVASGADSTISGGISNAATGIDSTVCGGNTNSSGGDFSYTCGRRAKATAQ